MLLLTTKKPAPHRKQAKKAAADFAPIFKSLSAIGVLSGIPAKLVGARVGATVLDAQLAGAQRVVADHRRDQEENGAADAKKLADMLDSTHQYLKNQRIALSSPIRARLVGVTKGKV
jgi:hypothetical protein